VVLYVPKTKSLCGTLSLKTRVGIAAAIMSIGYSTFWTQVFVKIDLETDIIFVSSLIDHDKKKTKKKKKQRSKEEKLTRSKDYFAKVEQNHKEQIHDAKMGKTNSGSAALATTKKRADTELIADVQNLKGTPKKLWPLY